MKYFNLQSLSHKLLFNLTNFLLKTTKIRNFDVYIRGVIIILIITNMPALQAKGSKFDSERKAFFFNFAKKM